MGLFDRFTNPQPQQQQPQQQQPQSQAGATLGQNNPNASVPSEGQQAPSSPLDPFKDLWKTDPTKPTQPIADPFSQPLFNTDPAKIIEAAGKADFLSQVPPELMQKVMAGNDPQALTQLINSVAQQSLALSLQLSTATVEQAGTKMGERFNSSLPEKFKGMQLDGIKPTNPALQHPAAEPMLRNLRDQVRRQEPNLSPDEVNAKAEQYLSAFAAQLSQPANPDGTAGKKAEDNWDEWASDKLP
jgi:hypothetical protein